MKKINTGLFGFGVVGEGIYQVLAQKPQIGVSISKVVIKHPEKERNAPLSLFSTQADDILTDENIELVVELIDDAKAAYEICTKAMKSGKSVISANKKMIAENHKELIETAKANNVSFLYEAAVCASIPIIRNLEEYFNNDLLTYVKGIVNGSTNYILTKMSTKGIDYFQALKEAQDLGFAESDPSLDVEGFDAANKLKIIVLHAFGKFINEKSILCKGITELTQFDFKYAKEKGYIIKLIASCEVQGLGEISSIKVFPTFVLANKALSLTHNEYNGVLVGGQLADEQFFYGKGAGRYPTSSAVLSDISACKYNYKYEYKKGNETIEFRNKGNHKIYLSYRLQNRPDLNLFNTIDESYESTDRAYVVGKISAAGLEQIIDNKTFSIILFD